MDVQSFVTEAERHCQARGCKMTTLRRQVLELVLRHDGVVKAYQVLADLQQERGGSAAPPTVYRALDFLVEQGLLHRVEALNGYIVCDHVGATHESLFLVCRGCGAVCELDAGSSLSSLSAATAAVGFVLQAQNLVLTGTCQRCLV
ncbi:MAG: transcriptional repressor [Paludibacterium sp.]|uniref:Fur family transcriptional regulator n=1 Tax=Paludibacterium sp. TaxID=1917523 RepID=UPI0025DCBF3E|nr:Fur family transcriptional regulator [Paludibacterium sp.]MBV8048849.1 transcriptional repressor [Paludibacterium sp.]MBV8646494.1 transcriptional repressor [Paludibacterium sp.]